MSLAGAAAARDTRQGSELGKLNTLAAVHSHDTFLAALERAATFGRWRSADLRSILAAAGIGTPPEPHCSSSCPPRGRSLAEYAPA